MRRLRKFFSLAASERRLLLSAVFLTAGVRLGLWLLPFRTLRSLLSRLSGKSSDEMRRDAQPPPERVAWAVGKASACVPHATCLTQALTTQTLLKRRGCEANLRFGVVKDEAGRLQAHAWVESRGRVVIGDAHLSRYTPLAEKRKA